MGPALREAYRRRLPFCRETVLATVDRVGSAAFLRQLRAPVPAAWQGMP